MTTENEWPHTTELIATAADAETFPPWTEMAPVMATSEHGPSVAALVNGTKAPNMNTEGNSTAPNTAMTAAAIPTQHPAVTPEAAHDEPEVTPDVPLGTTPVLADVKEDISTDLSSGTPSLPTTPPLAVTWVPQPTAGVTVLLSQGLTTAKAAVEEGVTLPEATQSEATANSMGSSPDAGELLPTQQDGAVGGVEGINPEPEGETAPAGEESPFPSDSGDPGDAINGEFSTANPTHLPTESPVMSGTVESPGKSSLLPGQALSPDTSLTPSNGGDGDGQGIPGMSSDASGSALLPAASRAPVAPEETEDTATSLPAPGAPTDAQSDTNLPVSATVLPTEDVRAVDLATPSLQPASWQTPTGEQPLLLPDALTFPTDTPSAPAPAAPAPEAGPSALPEADGAAETPASPDLTGGLEAAESPSPGESEPAGMPAGAPQEPDGLGTGLSSDSDAPSPAPDGLAWPTAGIQGQAAEGVGDVAQAGDSEDAGPYEDTQSDMSPPALQPSASPADNGELLTGGTEDLANAELSPPSALGDGTGTGGAPALGQVSSPGPAPHSSAGMEPGLSGPEGPGDLPSESANAPGAVSPPLGSVTGPVSDAETPVSPDLSAAQGAPGSPSFGGPQPWGTAAGAPVGAGLPGAQGPDTDSTLAWDTPSSAAPGPVGPPSPGLGDQLGTNVGLPAAAGQGGSAAEPALEGAGSGIESEPSLGSPAGSGIAAGLDQLPGAGSSSGVTSPSDVVAAPSVSGGDEAGPVPSAAPGPDSLSPASPDGETGPGFGPVQGAGSAGDVVQAGNTESENPNTETNPSAVSPEQDLTNTGELPAEETGDMANAELSPPSALGDGTATGTGGAPALGQVSSPGPAPHSSAGMEPDLSGPEGPGDLPSESANAPGAVSPPLGSVAGPVSEAETPVSPDLSAAQGAPGSPSFGGPQPWGTAAGAPVGAGLPGAQGPDTDSTLAWDTPSSAVHGPVGPPSPGLGDQLGTNVGLPAAAGQGGSAAEPALEGAGSGIESEPSLGSPAGSGIAAGLDQLPGAGSSSGVTSPSDVVAAPSVSGGDEAGPVPSAAPGPDSLSPASPDGETGPGFGLVQGAGSAGDVAQAGNTESENPNMETNPSAVSPQQGELPGAGSSSGSASPSGDVSASSVSDPSSLGALGGADSAAEGLQPSLGAGTGVLPAAGEGASEGAGDGASTGQSQAPAGMGPAGSESLDGETGGVLQSASSSLSTEASSPLGRTDEAADETSPPGAAAAGGGLNTGLEAAGPQEASVSAPGTQSGANTELSDGKLSEVNVVEVPGGASVNGGPFPGASPVPVAPDSSSVSNGMTTSVPGSLLLPGHGLSSGLAPSGIPNSAPSTQTGSSPLLPGSPSGLSEEAGGAQSWSLEDEVASGMPAPVGEASPPAPTSPNAVPVLPSAPQRGNSAEGVSASPGLSALPAVPLYGYGARENDQEYVERRVDFNSPLFKPETGFPFGKTLRTSLYFTDNGQIIFPASDNNILTYPNPPPRGFNGHEEVPMIAVFWDNADFSRGVGTTFYQEFSTLNTAKPPFVRDVEAKVRRYLRSSYSAAWTLKITWEKAPAYAARTDTQKTITYQAVLTTDGFRSYILMLYQDGGMQWDYTRLTSTNVLIGYTSGDGFYHNDDLIKRPPAAKYRPDQFRGYNTDLRGLWIYKLESRVGNNYRLKCLAWTGQQQEPRAWSQGLPTCPCSLQQGQQDPRFKSSRGGKWTCYYLTLPIPKVSFPTFPARVAGVPCGRVGR
nr:collagen alpha-1(I) chain [Taeniopygia guttata]